MNEIEELTITQVQSVVERTMQDASPVVTPDLFNELILERLTETLPYRKVENFDFAKSVRELYRS